MQNNQIPPRPPMPGQQPMPPRPGQPGQMPPGQQRPGMPPQQGGMPPQQGGMPPQQQQAAAPPPPDPVIPLAEGLSTEVKKLDGVHIDELLGIMVDRNASDLHICMNCEPCIREDGTMKRLNYEKYTAQQTQRMLYEILSDQNINKFETTLELDFSYSVPHRARFRVNYYKDKGSVAAAFRLIAQKIPTVKQLGLPSLLETLVEKPRGLILVTGPTGSGKSTTLAAMINHINCTQASHILTIEDPIEYVHQHKMCVINQREVGQDTKSFANALRAALREDPDVMLVGEMRDMETIGLAVTAAETGHLVFGTLHTNNAAESVDRMIDVFPPEQQEQIRVQLSNNLQAIISQQLIPKASGSGRVAANEIMVATPAIRNLIREAKSHQITSTIQTSANVGMITMDQCLRDLYLKGAVTLEEIMSRCQNQDELKKMITTSTTPPPGSGGKR